MIGTRTLARTLLASSFVVLGVNGLRKSSQLAPAAEPVADRLREKVGLDTTDEQFVQINAGVQVAGGALLAFGFLNRPAALILASSIIPTTIVGHPFWEADDEDQKQRDLIGFVKNASILGGLLFAALDTGGRPSVFWTGRKAAIGAADVVSTTAHKAFDTVAP
ncbi:DoxX family protein [Ilumatobacter sp.]|uniref:DoxX family protein n=1 Tax=Ilumatobacter sp. TaxID=1967498 RepID=UPI003B52F4DE